MNFASDNVTGVAPEVMEALAAANRGAQRSYGADAITKRLTERFAALFESEVAMFPVATGTAANALSLASLVPPYGAVLCHREAHINVDECGAPEFFTGGAKLIDLPGQDGKLAAATLAEALAAGDIGNVHRVQPSAASLTQSTELGTVYRIGEVREIADAVRAHGLKLHMDGARFGNAVASLGCAPADVTWRAGVDVLSFGGTKNGAMAAEAVLFFEPHGRNKEAVAQFAFHHKRAGQLFSKMRFVSAQLEALLAGDLWLRHARHANAQAARIVEGIGRLPGLELLHPVEANEIFLKLPGAAIDRLAAEGIAMDRWDGSAGRIVRLVTAFSTDPADVDRLIAAFRRVAAG
jgi:threonine aldolase